MPSDSVDRRPFLKAIAGGALALGAVGGASRVFLNPDEDPTGGGGPGEGPALQLVADPGSDVDSLQVVLGDLLSSAGQGRWRSARLPTSTYSMVALTWTAGRRTAAPQVHVRTRTGERWRDWQGVPALHDRPNADSGEGNDTTGTDVLWIGSADGIQVQVKGLRPAGLRLLLLHPRPRAGDRSARAMIPSLMRRRAGAVVPTPAILDRTAWGADESWRGSPSFNTTIEQVHVHHTVNRNDYSEADVPALIRGMYRYHTKTLGWSDLGYNFLVDRFGRVWTGRAGGAAKAVRGAHTRGFNETSTGISVIGNFDQVAPTGATLDAVAAVAAWKLELSGRDPLGVTTQVSAGSDRFGRGRSVSLPVIDGHRDTNQTACPGANLYAALPDIRVRARARMDAATAAAAAPVAVVSGASISGAVVLGQRLRAVAGAYAPADAVASYAWARNGVLVPGATKPSYKLGPDDVGAQVSLIVTGAKAGLVSVTETVTVGPVNAPGVIDLKVKPRRRKAVVKVRVTSPDGSPVTGQVVVRSKGRRRTVTLSGGRARTKLRGLSAGRHPVRVDYTGGGILLPAKQRTAVRVR